MTAMISASMMCSKLINLKETIAIFEEMGINFLHIDVMDGEFVPNFGLGVDYIRGLREITNIPLDIHLMIKNPEYKLKWIGIKKNDIVSIHYESTYQIQRALDWLEPYGCKRFLAINPATPICVLEEIIEYIDGLNLLMVNPGFAGQKIIHSTINKASKVINFLKENKKNNISVEVDGNITNEHGSILREKGADIFVAGSSSIFRGEIEDYKNNIFEFKRAIERTKLS